MNSKLKRIRQAGIVVIFLPPLMRYLSADRRKLILTPLKPKQYTGIVVHDPKRLLNLQRLGWMLNIILFMCWFYVGRLFFGDQSPTYMFGFLIYCIIGVVVSVLLNGVLLITSIKLNYLKISNIKKFRPW